MEGRGRVNPPIPVTAGMRQGYGHGTGATEVGTRLKEGIVRD